MSCNGCRVLRKGCSESCMLRPCLQWIDTPESQGHATAFVAKFFGRAGLMSFISNVPQSQRPALFQSLLYEACGRTINPVSGAVGLLWNGNWHLCQAAVETVLRGGTLRPIPEFLVGAPPSPVPTTFDTDDNSEIVCPKNNPTDTWQNQVGTTMEQQENDVKRMRTSPPRFTNSKRRKEECLDLSLTQPEFLHAPPQQRPGTPSEESGASATSVSFGSDIDCNFQPRLLKLFV